MTDKTPPPTKFLWLDLEMTGLNPEQDVILEVAAEVTDPALKTLASYESTVQQDHEVVVARMQANVWWQDYPENRDEFIQKLGSGKSLAAVEQELVALVEKQFGDELAVLAGNTIYSDRMFIKRFMPNLDLKLHYRMLDVSAWKVIMQAKYGVNYEKKEVHRAFDDVQASIAELQSYLDFFKHD